MDDAGENSLMAEREMLAEKDLPVVRGKYLFASPLAQITWFRVGGPAEVLFMPADEADLENFLKNLATDIPLHTIGVGSNLLVRDGGLGGVVIRLGPAFGQCEIKELRLKAGAAVLDARVAKQAGAAGIAGLSFYRGIPGTIGGALRMNAGAYGGETKDFLVEAVAYDRQGQRHVLDNQAMGFSYRKSSVPDDFIFVSALFEGTPGDPALLADEMAGIMAQREKSQPIRERTGGSTFKNPDPAQSAGRSAWQLIEHVGGRGRIVGDAQMSELHCNFMINRGKATAEDLERLGETIRSEIIDQTGIKLQWEIKRIGENL